MQELGIFYDELEMMMTKMQTEKFKKFPIGSVFSCKSQQENAKVKYGWVTGLAFNSADELVFTVKWAHRQGDQMLHPSLVECVNHDWDA